VKTRELRLRLSASAEGIVSLSCINPTPESTESNPRFPLAATLAGSYNAFLIGRHGFSVRRCHAAADNAIFGSQV